MSLPKNFAGLSFVVVINLALQFLFQWYIIISFGAGAATDVFFGAMAIPQFILLVLSSSLTMVLIPIIAKHSGNEFSNEAWNYFQGVGALFGAIAILLLVTAQWWAFWILPGFKGANAQLAVDLVRIQLIAMVFSALLSVLWAIHSAKENFLLIEITSIIANIIAFAVLFFAIKAMNIYCVAWISAARILLQVLLLMKILGPYRKPAFTSPSNILVWKKLKPLIAGNIYYKTDMLVDRYLVSAGTPGQLTLLNLAQQLYGVGNTILSKIFVNTMMPGLSKTVASGDHKKYDQLLAKRLLLSFLCTAIIFMGIIFLGKWILVNIFSFKNFDIQSIYSLWRLLILLVGYWICGLAGSVTSGAFYAKGDTVTPTKIGAVVFTLYVPIKIFCYFKYGITGLAISISAYYIAAFLVQLFSLRKHFK